ncbi:MAG: hypothetical protein FWF51_10775 [Chitinivibrionia bacterium]|nr:hypothetical protein [Chitinivibrionia bacterium]
MRKLYFAAIFAGIVLFVAGCGDKSKADKTAASSNVATTSEASKSADGEWLESNSDSKSEGDILLDEYEKFIDDYVETVAKLNTGDETAMQRMQELSIEVAAWSAKLQDAAASGVLADERFATRAQELTEKFQNMFSQ